MFACSPAEAGCCPIVDDSMLVFWISKAIRWSTPAAGPESRALPRFLLVFGKIQALR